MIKTINTISRKKAFILFCTFISTLNAQSTQSTINLMEQLYSSIDGYQLTLEEAVAMKNSGQDSTYGEITLESAAFLFNEFKLGKDDVFYDLGSGVGKTVIQAYLTTPVKKAVGIELSPTRHRHAMQVKNTLEKEGLIDHERKLEFIQENITTIDFSDATLIYMCSVCYPDTLMKAITEKVAQLQPGVQIATLKRLPAHTSVQLKTFYRLSVNWHPNAVVYLYEITG